MEKCIFQIWSSKRDAKKAFMCPPKIYDVLQKAKRVGLEGTKLVLESNGTEICDDETLEVFAAERAVFIILDDGDVWTERHSVGIVNSPANLYSSLSDAVPSTSYASDAVPSTSYASDAVPSTSYDPQYTSTPSTYEHIELIKFELSSESSFDTNSARRTSDLSYVEDYTTTQKNTRLFDEFEIPWGKMPTDVMKILNSDQKLGKRINALANIIVDELRVISSYIPMKVLRSVAAKVAAKYPKSVIDKDEYGKPLSTTPISLITVMRNRNNTLNRTPKQKSSPNIIPLKHRKVASLLQSTCSNWQPPLEICTEEIEFKMNVLKRLYEQETLTKEEEETVDRCMNDCYAAQRQFLNNRDPIPRIEEIMETWPFLLRKPYLYQHFESLMSVSPNMFLHNYTMKSDKIRSMFGLKNDTSDHDFIYAIGKHFKENVQYLFKAFKIGATLEEVKQSIPTNTPWLATIETQLEAPAEYFIFIERSLVASNIDSNLPDAIMQVIAYFYVLNIMYPAEIVQTMEFLVRMFLQYYGDSFRGQKKSINNLNKVNTLIKECWNACQQLQK